MSFLDPYGENRRVPLVWVGRAVLLGLVIALALLARALWGQAAG